MGLIDAHQFFLDDIATAVADGSAVLIGKLELAVKRLTDSKVPPNQLPEIEKRLVDLLLDLLSNASESDTASTGAGSAWKKAVILAEAISILRDRREKPKPKKKTSRAPVTPAEPLVLADIEG